MIAAIDVLWQGVINNQRPHHQPPASTRASATCHSRKLTKLVNLYNYVHRAAGPQRWNVANDGDIQGLVVHSWWILCIRGGGILALALTTTTTMKSESPKA